ncbi:MAG: universal stress protein [Magnetospirillum sp.]|nr:universal stress protein [Magnetospirillum sp.]
MSIGEIVVHVEQTQAAKTRLAFAASVARAVGGRLVAISQMESRDWQSWEGGEQIVEWRQLGALRQAGLHARYADLTIVGQPPANGPDHVTELIMTTGRPFLVVPQYGQFQHPCRKILVAWNGSREATRAVFDAMPLMASAEQVIVLTLDAPSGDHGESPGADISLAIARHGARVEVVRSTAGAIDTGNALLSRVAEHGVDLLVMGAFSRHPLREKTLGGATHHVLRHMTVPVLLSH